MHAILVVHHRYHIITSMQGCDSQIAQLLKRSEKYDSVYELVQVVLYLGLEYSSTSLVLGEGSNG
jgi:hypothetical protein